MKRVVVTGMGMVSPLGCGVDVTWKRLINGESGIRTISSFDTSDIPAKIAGMVPREEGEEGCFNPDDWMPSKEARRVDTFILYGISAAQQAVEDSGWLPESDEDRCRTGIMVGSGIGGLPCIADGSVLVDSGKVRRLSPFFIPASLINLISGHVSIKYGIKGPNMAPEIGRASCRERVYC